MVDPAIEAFMQDRIQRRVDDMIKKYLQKHGEITDQEKKGIESSAAKEYSLGNWLAYCAKNVEGVSLTTHPSKYSHPDANSSPVYYRPAKFNIGLLTIGDISADDDVIFRTAAYMPIYQFLTLVLKDGISIINHLVGDTESIRKQFSVVEDYPGFRAALLQIKAKNTDVYTDGKIKQVYFPTESESYHLLSIVSSSTVMFSLKAKIRAINSYEDKKEAIKSKRDNEYYEGMYKEIKNITVQGHVKSQPQNISQLNKDNFGETYLLESVPPNLEKRHIHFPKQNFFKDSFYPYEYREVFEALHRLFKTKYNNINIREGRDYRLQDLMDRIIDKMWAVRAVAAEQYRPKISQLKAHQKIWLCEEDRQTRENEDGWLDKLCREISAWTVRSYEKLLGKVACKLGEDERKHILNIINQNREALR